MFVYTIEYYSVIRKNEIMSFATTWVNLNTDLLSEVSQREKDKYSRISLVCQVQKMIQMNLSMKQKHSQTQRTNLPLPRGQGKDGLGVWA